MSMTKQQQWMLAATCLKYVAKSHRYLSADERAKLVVRTLERQRPTPPWEYPWSEVVRSLRDRSEHALAKRGKSA